MLYTPEGITENIAISLSASVPVKKPSKNKSPHKFYELLDAKQKHYVRRLGADKSKRK